MVKQNDFGFPVFASNFDVARVSVAVDMAMQKYHPGIDINQLISHYLRVPEQHFQLLSFVNAAALNKLHDDRALRGVQDVHFG